jgi:outer membrane protein OmpA-like peptidoglycan-associated protein
MSTRSAGALILVAALPLVAAGCATKTFVREEVGKTEAKLGADVSRLEGAVTEERGRVTALSDRLGETRTLADGATQRAAEATTLARAAQARADEAGTRAGQAQARADEAYTSAGQAMTKASDADARLTRLWSNRHKRIAGDTVVLLFRFDRWNLDDRAETALLDLVRQLKENPQLVVELEGYTDSVGDSGYNIQLAQRRADAVRRFLVEKGVELHRINWIGLGDVRPVADNATPKGREQNRRVMVRVFGPAE